MKKLLPDIPVYRLASLLPALLLCTLVQAQNVTETTDQSRQAEVTAEDVSGDVSEAVSEKADKQPNWYRVEVIAFSRYKPDSVKEQWLQTASPAISELADGLNSSGRSLVPGNYRAAPKQLGPHAYSINRQRGLNVIAHEAWHQPGVQRRNAGWMQLQSDASRISTRVRISLSRYLHADIDMTLPNPDWVVSDLDNTTLGPARPSRDVHFAVSRKLKLDDLNYIDHPLAGIIIQIERFQPEKSTSAREANSPAPVAADG